MTPDHIAEIALIEVSRLQRSAMMPTEEIHTAYAVSRGSYRCRAFVKRGDVKHTFRVGIGDTAAEAVDEALGYIDRDYLKEGKNPPSVAIHHGRIAGALLDAYLFGDA